MLWLVGQWEQDVTIQNVGTENNKEEEPGKQLVQAQIASLKNKIQFVHIVFYCVPWIIPYCVRHINTDRNFEKFTNPVNVNGMCQKSIYSIWFLEIYTLKYLYNK